MNITAYNDFNLKGFWDDSASAVETYVEPAPTNESVISIEEEIGHRLPAAYIELIKFHNGGIAFNTCVPTSEPTS